MASTGMLLAGLVACGNGDALKVGELGAIGTLEDLTPKQRDFTLNAIYVDAPGKEVEVLRVRALASPNLQFLGAITTWPRDGKGSQLGSGFGFPAPAIRKYHPAFGTVIPAAETSYVIEGESKPRSVFVNLGFRLASGDVGLVHAMEVTYRVGDQVKRERSRLTVLACMSPCSAKPEDAPLDEWEAAVREKLGVVTSDSRNLPPSAER